MTGIPLPLLRLSEQFAALPGIGMKTAQRLAYHVLTMNEEQVEAFREALLDAHQNIHNCKVCQAFSETELCEICADEERDHSTICVVESPKDITAFERMGEYHGVYHVLHGLISPMNGIGPDQLYIKELLARLQQGGVEEVIMCTNPTVEGEATAIYLSRLLKPLGVTVTRLAYGVPVGSDLEYADDVTLGKALQNRNEI